MTPFDNDTISDDDVSQLLNVQIRMLCADTGFKRIYMIVQDDLVEYDVEALELGEWHTICTVLTFYEAVQVYNAVDTITLSA